MIGDPLEHGPDADALATEIASLRSEIGALVRELDRRRHDALDVRLQLRRHGGKIAIFGAGLALIAVARIALARERRSTSHRAANLVRVLALLSREDPADVRRAVHSRSHAFGLGAAARLAAALIQPRLHPPARFAAPH